MTTEPPKRPENTRQPVDPPRWHAHLCCESCSALLAKRDDGGVSIRRSDQQATITGDFTAAVTCYGCRTLNVLASRLPTPPPATAAAHPSAA